MSYGVGYEFWIMGYELKFYEDNNKSLFRICLFFWEDFLSEVRQGPVKGQSRVN